MGKPCLAALALALTAAACPGFDRDSYPGRDAFATELPVGQAPAIDVTSVDGKVCVRAGAPGRVRVFGDVFAASETDDAAQALAERIAADPPVQVIDGRILVGDLDTYFGDDGSWADDVVVDLGVEVPPEAAVLVSNVAGDTCLAGLRGEVRVEATSGDVAAEDVGGALRIGAVSGSVRVERAGQVLVDTTSGDVELRRASGAVTVTSVSGDVAVEDAGSSVNVTTTSGDVSVEGALAAAASWQVESTSGDVRFVLPPGESFHLDLESTSGRVESDFDDGELFPDDLSLRGQVGDDPDALVRATTTSGDIDLVKRTEDRKK